MPSFDSPITGGKKFTGRPLKEFNVPDEEFENQGFVENSSFNQNEIEEFQNRMNISQVEKEIKSARQERMTGKQRLSDGAKKRIEILLGMTRLTRNVEIEQNLFVLKSLKSKEISEAYMAASEFDGTVQSAFEIRRQLLARSLSEIAGISFEQFIGSDKLDDKLLFIDEMDHALLSRLYSEYLQLVEETKEKYAIKNEKDAQEVVEDLKK